MGKGSPMAQRLYGKGWIVYSFFTFTPLPLVVEEFDLLAFFFLCNRAPRLIFKSFVIPLCLFHVTMVFCVYSSTILTSDGLKQKQTAMFTCLGWTVETFVNSIHSTAFKDIFLVSKLTRLLSRNIPGFVIEHPGQSLFIIRKMYVLMCVTRPSGSGG